MNDAEREVWRTAQALNDAWTSGRLDELGDYFHENMVVVTPTERERLEGRAACVASWRRFTERTRVLEWRTRNPKVQLYGRAAVVTYYYDLHCETGGERVRLSGRDTFVMVRERGRWLAVTDHFSAYQKG